MVENPWKNKLSWQIETGWSGIPGYLVNLKPTKNTQNTASERDKEQKWFWKKEEKEVGEIAEFKKRKFQSNNSR